jgi:hypothetical protein
VPGGGGGDFQPLDFEPFNPTEASKQNSFVICVVCV